MLSNALCYFREVLRWRGSLFSSKDQHDAQELLAFLLEGLGEDLNLNKGVVVNQPQPAAILPPSDEGSVDAQLDREGPRGDCSPQDGPAEAAPTLSDAAKSKQAHEALLARERSVVAALFTGQYRCTLQCNHCDYVSSQFEPFNTLPLPLPEATAEDADRQLLCCVVRRDLRKNCRLGLRGSTVGDVARLICAAGESLDCKASSWVEDAAIGKSNSCQSVDDCNAESTYFVAAELHPVSLRVRSFLPPNRKLEGFGLGTAGGAMLCLFEVDPLATVDRSERPQHLDNSVSPTLSSAPLSPPSSPPLVRVVFTLRRARMVAGRSLGLGGYDTCRPEQFSLPFIEVSCNICKSG
ncbi:hypothetical protein EON64_09585 [archaeon]|nr:MAG: hypothetical protein EON64_09585 [archaeon]